MAERVDVAPLRADARRNRARILEVAREVFASEGLAVPIDTVAARAGIGVGTGLSPLPDEGGAVRRDRHRIACEALATDARSRARRGRSRAEAFYASCG